MVSLPYWNTEDKTYYFNYSYSNNTGGLNTSCVIGSWGNPKSYINPKYKSNKVRKLKEGD